MKSVRTLVLAAALLTGLTATAAADVVIKMTSTDLTEKKPSPVAGVMTLGADRLAMKWDEGGDEDMTHVCFRGDRQLVWILDDPEKKYMEITKAEMAKAGQQVSAAMDKMKAELEKLPPEQRKMMEEMMAKNPALGGGEAAGPKPERKVKRTSESRTINGFPCTKYEVFVEGVKDSDVWTTPFDKSGLKMSDFAALEQFIAFFDELMGQLNLGKGSKGPAFAPDLQAINGLPIQTIDYDSDGKPTNETVFNSVTRGDVPAAEYELPKGYAKKEMFQKGK